MCLTRGTCARGVYWKIPSLGTVLLDIVLGKRSTGKYTPNGCVILTDGINSIPQRLHLWKNNDISLHQLLNQRKAVLLAIMRIFNPFISSTSHQGASLYSLFQFPVALMSKDKGAAALQREVAKIWLLAIWQSCFQWSTCIYKYILKPILLSVYLVVKEAK